jgi:gp16 family phage-associated protein
MSARKPKDTNAAQARVLTPAQIAARKWFEDTGMSVAAWSREHGFSEVLVSLVLNGKRMPIRGQSHAIAVALGIKQGLDPKANPLGGKR